MFYGWKIVAALFVVLAVTSGLGFYNQSVMIEALSRQGFSVADASTSVSVFFLTTGLLGPLVASVMERVDIRPIVVFGALVGGIALAMLGQVQTRVELFSVQCLFGVGFCAAGLLPATTLVARWFEARRAAALSIASTGLSVGGILVTPVSAALIGSIGFPDASVWLGLAWFLGVAPLAIIVLRSSPESLGLSVDGGEAPKSTPELSSLSGINFRDAIRGAYFWVLGGAWVFVMAAQVGGIAHQYGIVSNRFDDATAPLVLGVLPLFSIIGRLSGGYILDRGMRTRPFTLVMIVLQAMALSMMALAAHPAMLIVGLAILGITVGNLLMLQPLLIAEAFGPKHYARLYSTNNVLTMVGVASGPLLMGLVLEGSGGYGAAYLIAAMAGGVGLMLYALAKPPPAPA